MLQTKQKTGSPQRTEREQERSDRLRARSGLETIWSPAAALQAILAGAQADKLPVPAVLALSHKMGNAALTETLIRLNAGPELSAYRPAAFPAETPPFDWAPAAPETAALEAPPLPAMSALPAGVPAAAV